MSRKIAIKPSLKKLPINTANSGYYAGYNITVAGLSKILTVLLILWAAVYSEQAGVFLEGVNNWVTGSFGGWYLYVMFFFVAACIVLAVMPFTAKVRLGKSNERPEFSNFSWIAMMFGAGIGTGVLTYSTAEPMFHFSTNPDVITGLVGANSVENARSAMKWSILHWGLSAWGCYAITGLALAFFGFNRGLPLTVRSALTPLFGKAMSGPLGHVVDIIAVLATIVGVAITIGYGVAQFASGLFNITGSEWMMTRDGVPTLAAMLSALIIVMGISTVSALSGVEKGIKWLSNVNMVLTIFLLGFFLIFGSTLFAMESLVVGIWDYVTGYATMATHVYTDDGTSVGKALVGWQASWTIFYWAWWIAFAPFVGLFLARVSRGRTVREFILGAMIVPSLVCFTWFAFLGGTAIDLELSGAAKGAILEAGLSSQLFATINVLLTDGLAAIMSAIIVVLLVTFLVTSAQSAILVIHTISSAGEEKQRDAYHIILWGVIITLVIAVLLAAGGLGAINTAMIIGALPFSFVMALMTVSLIKALVRDEMRAKDTTGSAVVDEMDRKN